MKEKMSTGRLMRYSGTGLVVGATAGMLIGMVVGLEKVGQGLIFGSLAGIVFGPAVSAMRKGPSGKNNIKPNRS